MKSGQLADYFQGVGVKRLSAVDAELRVSNQHEIGTTKKMREDFLGEEHRREFEAVFYIWFGENQDPKTYTAWATHYDTRAGQPKRSPEWRLYYPSNPVTEAMKAGDTLFLALRPSGRLLFIVTEAGSTSENQFFWLFGLQPDGTSFVSQKFTGPVPKPYLAVRSILAELGIEYKEPDADVIASIMEPYGYSYPSTAELSQIARESLPEIDAKDDPDAALAAWLNREWALFLHLENRIVSVQIKQLFGNFDDFDVEQYFKHAISAQNRRYSRMGSSLEHQIAAVLDAHDVAYVRQAVTELDYKPDFIFPGLEAYRSAPEGAPSLTFLGAKSTCRDRWRQILPEAAKIPHKHLLTLQCDITMKQINQMAAASVQLVIPKEYQATYSKEQLDALMSFREFIEEVKRRSKLNP